MEEKAVKRHIGNRTDKAISGKVLANIRFTSHSLHLRFSVTTYLTGGQLYSPPFFYIRL